MPGKGRLTRAYKAYVRERRLWRRRRRLELQQEHNVQGHPGELVQVPGAANNVQQLAAANEVNQESSSSSLEDEDLVEYQQYQGIMEGNVDSSSDTDGDMAIAGAEGNLEDGDLVVASHEDQVEDNNAGENAENSDDSASQQLPESTQGTIENKDKSVLFSNVAITFFSFSGNLEVTAAVAQNDQQEHVQVPIPINLNLSVNNPNANVEELRAALGTIRLNLQLKVQCNCRK